MSKKRGNAKARRPKQQRGHKSWCAKRHAKAACTCGAEERRR